MYTAQLCVQGACKQSEIIKAFGVSRSSVLRSVNKYREEGIEGFYKPRRTRSASVMTPQVIQLAEQLFAKGNSKVEIARELAASLSLGDEITYLQGDFERMECLDDDSHDGLVSFSCIRYVPDPLAALRQARRVVKPGSRVVVDFPNRFCPWFKYLKTRLGVNVHFGDRHFSANESATCSPRPAWSRFGSLNACSRPLSRLRRSCWLSSSWIWLESGRQA